MDTDPVPGGGGNGAVAQAKTDAERAATAKLAVEALGLTMPTLVDTMDDNASLAYGAWPDRIYVVDTKGKIIAAGEPGPRGFSPDDLEAVLRKL